MTNFRMQTFILVVSLLHVVFFAEAQWLDAGNTRLQRRDGDTTSAVERLCRITSHQSAIINNTLYLMGGNVVYGLDRSAKDRSSQIAAPNTYLRTIDLTQDFNLTNAFRHTYRYDIPRPVPDISKGHLWADDDRLVLLGGLTEGVNKSFPNYTAPTEDYDVWHYDLGRSGDRIWKALSMGRSNNIMRVFNAAGIYVKHLRKGFLLGGMVSHDSQSIVPESMGNVDVGGLLIWNGVTESWENNSTPWNKRHSTGGFYLPYGEQGVLAFFGGLAEEKSQEYDNLTFPMNRIDIYDIGEGKWYSQNTTGTVPSHRTNFCGQVVSAPDNSTHQIYIFGGATTDSILSADIYVLTIPTFKWQLASSGDVKKDRRRRVPLPREYATCNLVSGGHAMMIYGGKISVDIKPTSCDDDGGVYLFDLNDWKWKLKYSSNPRQYEVPEAIWSTFPGGNNTRLGPDEGFENPHIEELMGNGFGLSVGNGTNTNSSIPLNPTTSSPESPQKTNSPHTQLNHTNTDKAALAGAFIAGILATASFIGGFYWYYHHRSPQNSAKDSPMHAELNDDKDYGPIELPAIRFSGSHQPHQLNSPEPVEMLAPSIPQPPVTGPPPPPHRCLHCPHNDYYVGISLDDAPPPPPK